MLSELQTSTLDFTWRDIVSNIRYLAASSCGGLSLLWLFLCYLIIFLCCQICYNYRNGGMKFSFSSDFVLLRKCYCCCYVVSAVYIYSHKGTKLTSEIDSCQCHDGIVYMVYMPNHMAIT